MQDQEYERKILIIKIIAGLFVGFVLISIIFASFQKIQTSTQQKVSIYVVPTDSKIVINDKQIKNDSHIYLKPGKYQYTVSRDHFDEKRGEIEVKDTKDDNFISAILEPNDADGLQIYQKTPNDIFLKAEEYAGYLSVMEGKKIKEHQPLIEMLPYKTYTYVIGYKNDASDKSGESVIITIHSDPFYYNSAIKQINDWGYDLVDYKVEFKNEENLFK